MRRLVSTGIVVVMSLAVYSWVYAVSGKNSGSGLFLALSMTLLVVTASLLFRAAVALFREPPAVEVAVATGRRRKELEREKQLLLKALKELEFDHEMRKVSDGDFTEISGAYRARAIRVMRLLDDRQVDYAALVEEEVQRQRRKANRGAEAPTPKATGAEPAAVPVVVAAEVPGPVAVAATGADVVAGSGVAMQGACPSCATPNDLDAVFCKKCATRLFAEVGA